jgi:hypothetical protein
MATTAELSGATTEFSRFRTIVGVRSVAVDSVGEYTDADGTRSVVASCDIFDFTEGLVSHITSYTVELT